MNHPFKDLHVRMYLHVSTKYRLAGTVDLCDLCAELLVHVHVIPTSNILFDPHVHVSSQRYG